MADEKSSVSVEIDRSVKERAKKNKKYLIALTIAEVRRSYECQKKNGDWTFYQEREFVENLFHTRFNFLITVYTLFLLSFFQVNDKESKIVVLVLGLITVGIMGLAVYRVYVKFDVIMAILHELGKYHVLPVQSKETKARKIRLFGVNPFIAWVMPSFLLLSIIIMGIMIIVFDFKFQ